MTPKLPPPTLFLSLFLLLVSCATPPQPSTGAKVDSKKAYQAGDSFPDMAGRPQELIPDLLPSRVRYHFADNGAVTKGAERLKSGLAANEPALFSQVVMVQPGAWSHLKKTITLDLKDAAQLGMMDPQAMTPSMEGALQGRIFRTPHAVQLLAAEMARLLKEDGGFHVRALQTREMARWWCYIGFDIEEPVYVVETEGKHYRFIVTLVDGAVFAVDELNGLPGHD